jgi:hypothetical protein
MAKPNTIDGYSEQVTNDCERVLVTLLRNLGPWKDSIFLVGGLTPRYLVPEKPPVVPPHAGTLDIDIVVDILILETTEAYKTLEENLRKIGFDNATNSSGQKQNWRWKIKMDDGNTIILELLADRSDEVGPRVQPLPTEGNISALNVPFSSMVIDLHDCTEITAELLGGDGITTETIRYANIVSFVCLKAMALEGRVERKDPHDLVYCIEHINGGIEAAAAAFREQMEGKHRDAVHQCIGILEKHFVTDEKTEGYLKDGPTMVANFELGESETREARILRQRNVSDVVELFLKSLGLPEEDIPGSETPLPEGAP